MEDEVVTCGVCMGVLQGATQLGCGHALCVGCVIAILERLEPLCPFCRTAITHASPSYNLRQVVDALPPPVDREADEVLDAATIARLDRELQEMLPAADGTGGGVQRPWVPAWLVVIAALVYLVCPFDGDTAGFVGMVDDLIVLGLAAIYVLKYG